MKVYGDEEFIHFLREELEDHRNNDIQKGSVWTAGEELLFSEREILKKKLWMWLPNDFRMLGKEIAKEKYPGEIRPELIYTNNDSTINISFTYQQETVAAGADQELCSYMKQAMPYVYPDISILDLEPVHIGEKIATGLAFVTPAIDGQIYNRMFFIVLEGKLLIGSCNCLEQDREDWDELFEQMIASIRVAES